MAHVQRRNSPRKQRACSICHEACSFSYIFCDHCSQWVHTNCDCILPEKVRQYECLPLDFPYICRKCRCDEEGNLDYGKALLRLHKAALQGFKKLQSCVKREDLFLDGPFVGMSGVGSLAVDIDAQALLERFSIDKGIPAATSSMDHVLFRAVSLSVSAKDSLAYELRVRCCVEMVKHEQYYRYQKNHHLLARCSPDYIDSCIDCAMVDEGSSAWTISALASVIQRPIKSVYPNVNGPSDPAVQALNSSFEPREGGGSVQIVRILWSTENEPIVVGRWKPNHFVPLFDQQKSEPSPPAKSQRKHPASDLEMSQEFDEMENFDVMLEGDETPESSSMEQEFEQVQMEPAQGGYPIEFGKFMDVFEAFEKITTADVIQSQIPRGLKENVWFLVDNTHNMEHPERRNTFFDDCGVWDSRHGSVAKSHLLLDDNGIVCTLKIHGGVFKRLVKNQGKQQWVTIDPQPDPDKVVVCHRYYAFLKRSTQYKRRIIWFTLPPSWAMEKEVALVEYLGKFPGYPPQRHGNSKRGRGGARNYIRTDPKLLEDIANQIKKGTNLTPLKLFKEMQKKLGPNCTLRDPRQIRNLKYSILKREKKEAQEIQKKVGGEITIASPGSEVIVEDVGTSSASTKVTKTVNPTPIKVIIQQGHSNMEAMVEDGGELAEGTEFPNAKLVEMGEGQQAITFMDNDANGIPDPTTQTIIMIRDLSEALAGNEVIVTQAL